MLVNADTTNVLEATAPSRRPAAFAVSDTPRAGVLGWLGRTIPTALVLLALSGLAYWGHHNGWTVPKFSSLVGKAGSGQEDWCPAHGVPESQCVECVPGLLPRPREYGWCMKHGVPDCPLEHPDVAQLTSGPQVTDEDLQRAQRALALLPRPENNSKCKLHLRRIQFASEEAFQRSGIDVMPVSREPMAEFVTANGEVSYDQTRVARLSARLSGSVWRVDKKVGDAVKQGEIVALVEAAEVGRAKAEFLQAIARYRLKGQTMQRLRDSGATISRLQINEAEAAVSEAHILLLSAQQALVNLGLLVDAADVMEWPEAKLAAHLQLLGLTDELRRSLDPKTTTANLLPVKAPLDGVVIARDVVAGEIVDTAKVLLTVADLRRLWLTLHVREEDAKKLALGQLIHFRTSSGDEQARGSVSWISTAVDEKTRTVSVRAELANADGRLRANSFGQGRVVLREEQDAIVVPNEAVHWEGDCHVVFVRDKGFLDANGLKVFHTRTIRPGAKNDKYTEIIAGVLPGEAVATKGSGILRAELLKNNLGEG